MKLNQVVSPANKASVFFSCKLSSWGLARLPYMILGFFDILARFGSLSDSIKCHWMAVAYCSVQAAIKCFFP